EALELAFVDPTAVGLDECRSRSRSRALEEGADHMRQSRLASLLRILHGQIDVAWTVRLVSHLSLGLEHGQQRTHGRVRGCIGYLLPDVRRRGPAPAKEHIHDLSFAPGQWLRTRVLASMHVRDPFFLGAVFLASC